jgi:hypothetical protein
MRQARTGEAKPLITLALLLQAPLFAGAFAQLLLLTIKGAFTIIPGFLLCNLIAALFITAGAALASQVNACKYKEQLKNLPTTC